MYLKINAIPLLVVTVLTAGCQQQKNDEPDSYQTKLTVVTANMWHSLQRNFNNSSSLHKAVAEMKYANADVILTSEASGVNARLAEALNMHVWQGNDSRTTVGILSRYPIKEVFQGREADNNRDRGANIGAILDVNGRDVVVWSNHLDYTNYITYDVRGGNGSTWQAREGCLPIQDPDELDKMNEVSNRPAQARYMMEKLKPYIEQGAAVIVGGDFNEASGLDWTENTANKFDHRGAVYDFSTNKSIRDAGLTDSYRDLYPDPVTHPGLTWPFNKQDSWMSNPSYKHKCGRDGDDRDRIDFIYYNKNALGLKLIDASIIWPRINTYFLGPHGEDDTYQWDDKHTGLQVLDGEPSYKARDFVSDHLWYKTTFIIETPQKSTTTLSQQYLGKFENITLEAEGEDLRIRFKLSNFPFWENDRDYYLEVSGDSSPPRAKAWISQLLTSKPEGDMELLVSQEVLKKWNKESYLHNGLQLRVRSNVASWQKQFAVVTIPTEEIKQFVDIH